MSVSWTIAYRKPHANRYRRAVDWSGTQDEATQLAARFAAGYPALQVCTTSTTAHTVRAGTGKRVLVVDTGTVGDLMPRGVRYIPKAYLRETEWEWGVYDLVGKAFVLGGCDREEAVALACRAHEVPRRASDLPSA